MDYMSGSDGGEVTPVPIPNTAVKFPSADGSWGFASARVGRRQAKKPAGFWPAGFIHHKTDLNVPSNAWHFKERSV